MNTRSVVVLLAAVTVAAVTARLGAWQLDRAAQKQALQDAVDSRGRMSAVTLAELAQDAAQRDAQLHRPVRVEGAWLTSATVYLDNRQMGGRPGFFVITPLALADGTAILVQRGWLPRDPVDRTRVAAPAPPEGRVRVEGRIAGPPSRLYEFDSADSGAIRQNLDMNAFAEEHRLRLRPISILQMQAQDGETPGLRRDWPAPTTGLHKHHGYAFQWFALSGLTLLLYLWFQVIRPRRRRSLA